MKHENENPAEVTAMSCTECGNEMWIDVNGVSHHWGDSLDDIDFELDADHVALARGDYP